MLMFGRVQSWKTKGQCVFQGSKCLACIFVETLYFILPTKFSFDYLRYKVFMILARSCIVIFSSKCIMDANSHFSPIIMDLFIQCYNGLNALTRRLFLASLCQCPVWWEITLSETFPIYICVEIP